MVVVGATEDAVREWIISGVLYVLGIGLIGILGGIGAAGEALRNWGRASASLPPAPAVRRGSETPRPGTPDLWTTWPRERPATRRSGRPRSSPRRSASSRGSPSCGPTPSSGG